MFTKSDGIKSEYCAQIVRIGELIPIEGSDFLAKTNIGGVYQVVVGKNDVKTGDIMVYCKLETAINKDFLSTNNQFEIGERHLNKNYEEVQKLIDDGKEDEAKKKVGYFNKHGRVRIVKLRGCASEGCLFPISSLAKWKPDVRKYDFENCFKPNEDGVVVPFEFDTIDGELFVKAFVPEVKQPRNIGDGTTRRERKRKKKIEKLDRMIEGQFTFHFDTNQLNDNVWRFNPDMVVNVSVKFHGTSFICGNVLTKRYLEEGFFKKLFRNIRNNVRYFLSSIDHKKRPAILPDFVVEYGEVTSSRGVIKNQYINKEVGRGFYKIDIWSEYGKLVYPFLKEGMTLYGEIVGYVTDSTSMIQKGYDYGCKPGENKLIPYRITETDKDGNHKEWNVQDVYEWTVKLLGEHPELNGKIKPITILYHGRLGDLYPDIDASEEYWSQELLKMLKEDKKRFGMELDEPMCKIRCPREGIVIRIDDDVKPEAFKLKTEAFKFREAKQVDAGEVDMEMQLGYGNENE
jgi:hypothetical protein